MTYGAIDLHARYSNVRVVDDSGTVLLDRRVVTRADRLVEVFARFALLRVVVESGTESEWVAEALEAAGHEVVVVDPNFAPMYGERQRKVKTNERDVAALCEANRRGWYRPAHRTSPGQREVRRVLRTREQLVKTRTGAISVIRALVRQVGLRVPSGSAETFAERLAAVPLPAPVAETVAPLRRVIAVVTEELRGVDQALRTWAAADPMVQLLQTAPGVGLVVATAYRAFVDDVGRFSHAGQVSAAIGLVPREDSSAERRHRGRITKAGPQDLRRLLVQAAWACWRSHGSATLRAWVEALAARRGKRVAVVALARRLSCILYAMCRDQTRFDAKHLAAA